MMKKLFLLIVVLLGFSAAAFANDGGDAVANASTSGKNRVELVFVVDKSGSMEGLEKDTIGGFNSMLKKQKETKGAETFVTTVLFDTNYNVIHDRAPLETVNNLTSKEYFAGGCTALLDAVGTTINRLERVPGIYDGGNRVLFVIITDGYENSSKEYTRTQVKDMITKQKKEHDWEFMYLGANIDAVKEAGNIGINSNRAVTYSNDQKGVQTNYKVLNRIVGDVRSNEQISDEWKKDIEDHNQAQK
jgi:uncharacterized protein YegL